MTERGRMLARGAAALALSLAIALVLLRLAAPAEGPVEPAWDQVACAHCHMLVGDPRFAAQLHRPGGEVAFFDDPGCLLLFRADHPGEAGRAWFHDSEGGGWLAEAETGFVTSATTPMGHGYAAVASRTRAGALAPEAVLAKLEGRVTP